MVNMGETHVLEMPLKHNSVFPQEDAQQRMAVGIDSGVFQVLCYFFFLIL